MPKVGSEGPKLPNNITGTTAPPSDLEWPWTFRAGTESFPFDCQEESLVDMHR